MADGKSPFRLLPILGTLLIATLAVPARASTNLLNVYVGASVGHGRLQGNDSSLIAPQSVGPLGTLSRSGTAYQIAAGARGLYLLGAEVDYFNLGSGSVSPDWSNLVGSLHGNLSQKGVAAFALLYLPLPVPFIDVYVKAGVGRITSQLDASFTPQGTCVVTGCKTTTYVRSESTTGLAAGAGVQWKLGNWAVRAEYERFTALGEHPDLLTVGVTWSIL